MIITKLTDGLGNQMFQYAFGRYLAEIYNTEIKLNINYYNNIPKNHTNRKYELNYFNIIENIALQKEIDLFTKGSPKMPQKLFYKIKQKVNNKTFWGKFLFKIAKKLTDYHTIYENNKLQLDKLKKDKKNIYVSGFWQSEDFFKSIAHIIQKEFKIKEKYIKVNNRVLEKIKRSNSVAIHVRRGDLITNPEFNSKYGVCSTDYYLQAINYIKKKISNPVFYFFSDDINWCKENFKSINSNFYIENYTAIEDLYLILNCKHQIIANSSFSWWGAWLNKNKNKIVVAPKKWAFHKKSQTKFNLLPNSWKII